MADFTNFPSDGSYIYEITAESSGVDATAVTGTFKVDATYPTATLTEPSNNATVDGVVQIQGTADDAANFDKVVITFDPDGSASNYAPEEIYSSISPTIDQLITVLNTTVYPNNIENEAPAELTMTVYDKAGNISTTTRSLMIANPVPDTTQPSITLTATHDGQTVTSSSSPLTGTLDVNVSATDNEALAKIELLLDDTVVASTDIDAQPAGSLAYSLQTYYMADGVHALAARVTDASGNVATQDLTFLSSSPISNFKVTPDKITSTSTDTTFTFSANLLQDGTWTLTFTSDTSGAIPPASITGTGNVISETLDAGDLSDGLYTATLTVDGLTGIAPAVDFAVDLVQTSPIASITGLAENSDAEYIDEDGQPTVIRDGLYPLKGTADDADLTDPVLYKVELYNPSTGDFVANVSPAGMTRDADGYVTGRVNSSTGNQFGDLDFTLTRNGIYDLVLTVQSGGKYAYDSARISLESQLKIGQFGFSQQDLVIPVSGLPLPVIRTYNSLNADKSGDFGHGWTYSIADVELEHDEPFSMRTGDIFAGRNVTVTLPDGKRTTFRFGLRRIDRWGFQYIAYYTAAPGIYASLEPIGDARFNFLGGLQNWNAGTQTSPERFEFKGYNLTTKDGTKYEILRENLGGHFVYFGSVGEPYVQAYGKAYLNSITDRNGNKVVFQRSNTSSGGLSRLDHYNASGTLTKSIVFEKDSQGRIIAIHDPNHLDENGDVLPDANAAFVYEYDTNDNLQYVRQLTDETDPGNPVYSTTEYIYDNPAFPHHITDIVDARGVTPLKTIYDDAGRMIATEDANGNRIELTHDLTGKTETVFDRQGNPTLHTYDTHGNVTATTNALGHTVSYTYDSVGNELTVTDPLGNVTTRTYSGTNVTSITDPLGNTTRFSYDGYGNQTSVTDPLGNKTTSKYDSHGNLTSTTDSLGNTTTNNYDADGNLVSTVDAAGNTNATFAYAPGSGNLTSVTDASGVTRSFTYDSQGNQTHTNFIWINPAGSNDIRTITTQSIYDSANRVIQSIDPDGNTSSTIYNEIGKAASSTDALGHTSTSTYDARGNLIESISPGDPQTFSRTVYDANGRAVVTMDSAPVGLPDGYPNGSRTIYDAAGRVVRTERLAEVNISLTTDSNGQPTTVLTGYAAVLSSSKTVYDAAGRTLESTGPDGQTTRYEYDDAGRQLAVTDAQGNRTTFTYDAAGRQTMVTDALGRKTKFIYDALGRRTQTVYSDGTFTSTQYDTLGRRTSETDQAGKTKSFEYDDLGRLTAVILPAVYDPESGLPGVSPRYEYEYDLYGNQSLIRDPKRRETRFTYDERNRQLTRQLPMGQTESREYDSLGRQFRMTDFKGQITQYAYDGYGRTIAKHLFEAGRDPDIDNSTQTIDYIYDDRGQQSQIVEDRGTTEFFYDPDIRLVGLATPEGVTSYEFDEVTGRKTAVFSANTRVEYAYDTLGRMSTVATTMLNGVNLTVPQTTTYQYTAVGSRASQTLPNGVTTEYTYDELNRLVDLEHFDDGDNLIARYAYSLAADGRRTAVNEQRRETDNTLSNTTIQYTYDNLNRLVQEHSTSDLLNQNRNFTTNYVYDTVGNRLSKNQTPGSGDDGTVQTITYTYNNNDLLLTETATGDENYSTTYGYNANGSLTSKSTSDDKPEAVAYGYNLEQRLSTAIIARIEDGKQVNLTSSYTYNQSGTRVRSDESYYLNEDTNTTVTQAKVYLLDSYNPTGYAQVFEQRNGVGDLQIAYTIGDDVLTQTSASAGTSGGQHLLYDGHGSTRLLTDNTAAIASTARYDYDAYGIALNFNPGITNQPLTNLLYSGEQFDPGLQQQYLRARYYDQSIGRFNRLDPFEGLLDEPQSLHKYTYTHCDPVNGTDPSGLIDLNIWSLLTAVGILGTLGGIYLVGMNVVNHLKKLEVIDDIKLILRQSNLDASIIATMDRQASQLGLKVLGSLIDLLGDAAQDFFFSTIMGAVFAGGFIALLGGLPKIVKFINIGIKNFRKYRALIRQVPHGLTRTQFRQASKLIREGVSEISDDIIVHGSRVHGDIKPASHPEYPSDIDFAVLVDSDKFDSLIDAAGLLKKSNKHKKELEHAVRVRKLTHYRLKPVG